MEFFLIKNKIGLSINKPIVEYQKAKKMELFSCFLNRKKITPPQQFCAAGNRYYFIKFSSKVRLSF